MDDSEEDPKIIPSRLVSRGIDKFHNIENHGYAVIDSIINRYELLNNLREREQAQQELPGRFGSCKRYEGINTKLKLRYIYSIEAMLEELRFSIEQLEVCFKQLKNTRYDQQRVDACVVHSYGLEFWRKKQMVESVQVTDSIEVYRCLSDLWYKKQR